VIAGVGTDAQALAFAQLGDDFGRETLRRFRFCA